jgi:hypothetical protein
MKFWHPLTLWLGMYAITALLFWSESGKLTTGLLFGLVSATLKTLWSLVHHKMTHRPLQDAEEVIRI